ncbi:hypothetical protein HPB50_022434 [Hyalomma asiaticum]|uniref:Uncharacterized protein n=1 Tax=Hyalomma asiaticum TaxID=266040 RepID=A0ACB7TMG9_HYAAI|nr:hypothetical protein HPB50_022434 [Hyalomma asiaticum]
MEPGTLVFGVLLAFVRHGMLLELPAGIRGFVPLKDAADEFLSDASKSGFVIGQCLVGKVTRVDSEIRQVWLSTSMRSCGEKSFGSTMECLAAQLADEELLSRLEQIQVPNVGSIIRVTVEDVDEKNQIISCKLVESALSATAEIVPGTLQVAAHSRLSFSIPPVQRRIQSGKVLHLKPSHAVVLLHSGHLCLVPTKSHFNSIFHLPLEKAAITSIWTWKPCGNVIVGCTKAALDCLGHMEKAKFHPRKAKECATSDIVMQPRKDSCLDKGKSVLKNDGEGLARQYQQRDSQIEQGCTIDDPDIGKGKNLGDRGTGTTAVNEDDSKHQNYVRAAEGQGNIGSFFQKSCKESAILTECLFTGFLVEHNSLLSVSDHAGPLFQKMFPKCKDSKRYGCGRTKTAAIVVDMAADAENTMVEALKRHAFAFTVDGSNDSGSQMYPIMATYYVEEPQNMESRLLCLQELHGEATGRKIGNLVLGALKSRGILDENCIAFSADNANVTVGKNNSVAAVLEEAP